MQFVVHPFNKRVQDYKISFVLANELIVTIQFFLFCKFYGFYSGLSHKKLPTMARYLIHFSYFWKELVIVK